ncbi:AraC family transcriptional regulator [Mesorhizobium sp.]|uniref:AraC family transcriptional regulator n=1 Tax=Mesorhizobium sp. TaxID=1871066 RepID=UPI000FE65DD9|nr:AraC family transcriptional regulator [Mesorhizobium sp.]RWI72193.1 MAG: AraC family transcriptional regulator [Mesorhizobium sp.]
MSATDLINVSNHLTLMPGIRSSRVSDAVEALSTRYRSHRLLIGDRATALDFRHNAIVCEGASLNLLRYGPELVVDAGPFDTFYMLEFPLHGGVDIQYGGERVSSHVGSGLVLSPGAYVRSRWRADTTQVMLRLERNSVERAWQRFSGESARRTPMFRAELDLSSPAGRRIARLIGLIVAEQMEAGDAALMPRPLINAVLETLFEHVPAKLISTPGMVARGPSPAFVRMFRRLLDEPENLRLTVARLACRLDVSQRTLTTGMRSFTGYSPHGYLTMRRMEQASRLIEEGGLSIAEIARRVGYAHAGRFAAAYRAWCGRSPSNRTRIRD